MGVPSPDEKRLPFLKLYVADWRGDPRLRMCSLAARGLWIDLLAIMHEAEPYGHLLVCGRAPTESQIASLIGAPADEVRAALAELEDLGVFSRNAAGVIVSRRMVRDAIRRERDRENGRKGGNPVFGKGKSGGVNPHRNPSDNPPDNPPDNPDGLTPPDKLRDQRLEARGRSASQGLDRPRFNIGTDARASGGLPDETDAPGGRDDDDIPFADVVPFRRGVT